MVEFSIFKLAPTDTEKAMSKSGQLFVVTAARAGASKPTTKLAQPAVEVNSKREYVSYWHSAFGFPSKSTFVRNILNGNINIDGLSATAVKRNFTPSGFTAMGHLDATRSNIKSTKLPFVSEKEHPHKTPLVWVGIHESTGRLHSDQTGALPILGNIKRNTW